MEETDDGMILIGGTDNTKKASTATKTSTTDAQAGKAPKESPSKKAAASQSYGNVSAI